MIPVQMIDRIREMLDDPEANARKVGQSYSTQEIISQLNVSTASICKLFFEKNILHRLQRLITFTSQNPATDVSAAPLPVDYMFPIRGQIGQDMARLYVGGIGEVFEGMDHFGVSIEGVNWVVKGAIGKASYLWYIKLPQDWAGNQNVDRLDFDRSVYNAIGYHTAAVLAIKNEGSEDGRLPTRYFGYFHSLMDRIVAEPGVMIMPFAENVA